MTKSNLLAALRRLKIQTGSIACLGCGHEHNCSTRGCAIIREAVRGLEQMEKYKNLYIDAVKASEDRLCGICKHLRHCDGKKCQDYIEGHGGYMDGKHVDFRWSCEDFDWGACPALENTPCHGCYESGYGNFELMEDDTNE